MIQPARASKPIYVDLQPASRYEQQERIAYGVVQSLLKMPEPPREITHIRNFVPYRDIPQLRDVRLVGFDVYDTLIKTSEPESPRGSPWTASHEQTAIRKALEFSGIPLAKLRVNPEQILELLGALAKQAETKFRIGKELIYPEADVIANWGQVLNISDYTKLVKVSTAYELFRAQYSIMPGADSFLSVLHNSGIKVGVISNTQVYTPAILDQLFVRDNGTPIRGHFPDPSLVMYSHRTELRGQHVMKPTRLLFETFYRNARILIPDLARSEVLFVGNSMKNDGASTDSGFNFAFCKVDPLKAQPAPELEYPHTEFTSFQELWHCMGLRLR